MKKAIGLFLATLLCFFAVAVFCSKNHSPTSPVDGNKIDFTIIFPMAGDRIPADSSISILWTASSATEGAGAVRISLYKDSSEVALITSSAPDNGRYEYSFSDVGSAGGYRIKISAVSDTAQYGFSGFFTIYSVELMISKPSAGTEWISGQTHTIQWDSTGLSGATVSLELCLDSTRCFSIAADVPNSGEYVWEIPDGLATDSVYRIKIASVGTNGLFAFSNSFFVRGIAPDLYEPDNSKSSARQISLNVTENRTLSLNDTDWIAFSADSGISYILLGKSVDSFQLRCDLFAHNDTTPIATDSSSAAGVLMLTWSCAKSGRYDARIVASAASPAGAYSFSVIPNDSLPAVLFLAPTETSIIITGGTTTIDWIPRLEMLGDSVSVLLYKGTVQLSVLASRHPTESGSFAWTVADTLQPGNDYRIKIENPSQPSVCGYSPQFIISDVSPDEFEDDGTTEKASHAIADSVQKHTITFNDTDCIRFSADSGSAYTLSATGIDGFQLSGTLAAASSGTSALPLWKSSGGRKSVIWTSVKSGFYFITVTSGLPAKTGAYTFEFSPCHPDTLACFETPATGVTWSVDSTYTLRWSPDTAQLGTTIAIELYSRERRLLVIDFSASNSGSRTWKIPSNLVSGNRYSIRLTGGENAASICISPLFTLNGKPGDDYEPDNPWDLAHGYTLGTKELHTLTENDTDWIRFSADSGTQYLLRLSGDDGFRTTTAFYYENTWNRFDPFIASASGALAALWSCKKNGVAYARINTSTGGLVATGSYSFTIVQFDPSKAILFLQPQAGAAFAAGDSPAVEWVPDTVFLGSQVRAALLKGSKEITTIASAANTGTMRLSLPEELLITGADYRIQLTNAVNTGYYGYSPAFTISGIDVLPDGYEVDDTPDKARGIDFNVVQQHNFILRDTDWVQFPTAKGMHYIFMAERADTGSNYTVRLHYGSSQASPQTLTFSRLSKSIRILTPVDTTGGSCFIECFPSKSNVFMEYSLKVIPYDSSVAPRITSPVAGAVFNAGDSITITWVADTSIYSNSVSLSIYNDDKIIVTLRSGLTSPYGRLSSNSFIWNTKGAESGSNYRVRIVTGPDSMVSVFGPPFAINGLTPDSYEPDDVPSQAATIEFGVEQQRNFVLKDIDWIRIPSEPGFQYFFKLTAGASCGLTGILYDSLNLIRSENSNIFSRECDAGQTTYALWTCKNLKPYLLKMTPNGTGGDYTIRVTRHDTTETARFSKPDNNTIWTAGAANTMVWNPDTAIFGPAVQIHLYKGNNGALELTGNIANNGSYTWPIPSYMENGNDYRVFVFRGFNSNQSIRGSYSSYFTIAGGLAADSFEPDSTAELAKPITLGATQRRTLPYNDNDWIAFEADSNTTYLITDSTSAYKVYIKVLYLGTSVKYFIVDEGQTVSSWSSTEAGTYYFSIQLYTSQGYSKRPGAYSIKVTRQ